MKIPDLTLQDERTTELDGKEYKLRPTLEVVFTIGMTMTLLDDPVTNFERIQQNTRAAAHKGMRFFHPEAEIDEFLDKISFVHLMAFMRDVAPGGEVESDQEDFTGPPEDAAAGGAK